MEWIFFEGNAVGWGKQCLVCDSGMLSAESREIWLSGFRDPEKSIKWRFQTWSNRSLEVSFRRERPVRNASSGMPAWSLAWIWAEIFLFEYSWINFELIGEFFSENFWRFLRIFLNFFLEFLIENFLPKNFGVQLIF